MTSRDIRHSPTPTIVHLGKEKKDRGEALPEDRADRVWYCRSCGAQAYSVVLPCGWYTLARHTGVIGDKVIRLGMYCCAECVGAQIPRIQGIEDADPDNWSNGPYRQTPSDSSIAPDQELMSLSYSALDSGVSIWRDEVRRAMAEGKHRDAEHANAMLRRFIRERTRRNASTN
jgi:hypothetical protein